jgi:hypothetical protein
MSAVTVWSDLLEVIEIALAPYDEPATAVVLVEPDRTGLVVRIDGASSPDVLATLGEVIVRAAERCPVSEVALATTRPCATPTLDDELAFFELRDLVEAAGIDLVDWVLVDEDVAISVATVSGAR